jgi:hypothetical protein
VPIHELPRKEWLLMLWKYHHGHLPDTEYARVKAVIQNDLQARTDAERVLEIINQLRQTGHWDPSPDFPERMLASLLGKTGKGGLLRKTLMLTAVILVLGFLLIWFRHSHQQASLKVEALQRLELPTPAVPFMDIQNDQLILKSVAAEKLIPSATSVQLKDPVQEIEQELDDWIQGPLPTKSQK